MPKEVIKFNQATHNISLDELRALARKRMSRVVGDELASEELIKMQKQSSSEVLLVVLTALERSDKPLVNIEDVFGSGRQRSVARAFLNRELASVLAGMPLLPVYRQLRTDMEIVTDKFNFRRARQPNEAWTDLSLIQERARDIEEVLEKISQRPGVSEPSVWPNQRWQGQANMKWALSTICDSGLEARYWRHYDQRPLGWPNLSDLERLDRATYHLEIGNWALSPEWAAVLYVDFKAIAQVTPDRIVRGLADRYRQLSGIEEK